MGKDDSLKSNGVLSMNTNAINNALAIDLHAEMKLNSRNFFPFPPMTSLASPVAESETTTMEAQLPISRPQVPEEKPETRIAGIRVASRSEWEEFGRKWLIDPAARMAH